MLHVDPGSRLSATQVLNHPWVAQREALPQFRLTLQDAQLVKVCVHFSYNPQPVSGLYRNYCFVMRECPASSVPKPL